MTRVRWPFVVSYAFALLGAWVAMMTPATVTLALRVAEVDPVNKATSYSAIATLGAVLSVIASPLFGYFSDRTTSRYGMRRPWILIGGLGACAGAFLIARGNSFTELCAGWAVTQILGNAGLWALIAVVADRVPVEQRGFLSGIAGMMPTAAIIVGSGLVAHMPTNWLKLEIPALVGLVGGLVFSFSFPDRVLSREDHLHGSHTTPKPVLTAAPARFWWCLGMIFLASFSIAVFQTYLVFFLADEVRVSTEDLPRIAFHVLTANSLAAAAIAPFAGALTDRLGSRRPVVVAAVIAMSCGLVWILKSNSLGSIGAGAIVLGAGYGALCGLATALVLDVTPSDSSQARNLGLSNVAITAPYFVMPAVAPLLLSVKGGGNYTALYSVASALTLLSLFMIRKGTNR